MKLVSTVLLLVGIAGAACATPTPAPPPVPPPTGAAADALPPPSTAAQKLYSAARDDLLQVRVLLKNGRTQVSVGSGFMVGQSNLVLTNYHVVSKIALDPGVYTGEYVSTDGRRGTIELLAVDLQHDLAVVRINRNGTGFFTIGAHDSRLTQGQYLYSMGNPLDLGFAISEGAFNGVITRSFYDQLLFTGPINAGMSGGPSVTATGEVAGINVAKRRDGELVSFLVPVRYARLLLAQVTPTSVPPKDFTIQAGQQLREHQESMTDQLLAAPFTLKAMGPYLVPVRESEQVRCWGSSSAKTDKTFSVDNTNCAMESALFVSGTLQTGLVALRHQLLRSNGLDPVRFAELATASFRHEDFGSAKDSRLTAPSCAEQFVRNKTLPLRAVLCIRAYRKFAGLYDFALLTGVTDEALISLQSRIDARGVTYANGTRITRSFLEALARGSVQ